MNTDETNIRRRVRHAHDELARIRQQEIGRALEFKNAGNHRMAGYYTGLADGRNAALAEFRAIMREYPESSRPVGRPPATVTRLPVGGAR